LTGPETWVVTEIVIFAFVGQFVGGQAAQQHLQRFGVHRTGIRRIIAEIAVLDRRDAAPDAQQQASTAHLVQHADLIDQPQRMIQRQRVDQRAEAQALRALRDGGQIHAGRGCQAQRRRVMLGHVIAVEAGLVVGLDQRQAIGIETIERAGAAIHVVKHAELHGNVPWLIRRRCGAPTASPRSGG
jgi:hypothetical protein